MLKYLNYILAVCAVILLSIAIANMVENANCKDDVACKIATDEKYMMWYGIVGTVFGVSLLGKLIE
jgi:hypothetical protein